MKFQHLFFKIAKDWFLSKLFGEKLQCRITIITLDFEADKDIIFE